LEFGGFDAAFPFLDLSTTQSKESGVKAAELQSFARPNTKLNLIGLMPAGLNMAIPKQDHL